MPVSESSCGRNSDVGAASPSGSAVLLPYMALTASIRSLTTHSTHSPSVSVRASSRLVPAGTRADPNPPCYSVTSHIPRARCGLRLVPMPALPRSTQHTSSARSVLARGAARQPRGATEHSEGHGDMYMTKAYVLGLTPHLRCADAGRFASAALTADGVPTRTSSLLTPPARHHSGASPVLLAGALLCPRSSLALQASRPPALVCKALVSATGVGHKARSAWAAKAAEWKRCQRRGRRREKRSSQVKSSQVT